MSICLSMIVKDEAKTIGRCLASVVGKVHAVHVHDTGSTDGSVGLVEDLLCRVPHLVTTGEFKNFEHARNQALEHCRRWTDCDWILLLDADMELVGSFPELSGSAYTLVQRDATLAYRNVRLVRREARAVYRGVTHEYLEVNGAQRLDLPWIRDHGDGGSKGDKHVRDIRLLEEGLRREREPGLRTRYLFYLAEANRYRGEALISQTDRVSNNQAKRHLKEAIRNYRLRSTAGGFGEEAWYSLYGIARCYFSLGSPKFLEAAWAAYDARPSRGEPLGLLIRWHKDRGQWESASACCELGLALGSPTDTLFVDSRLHEIGFAEEMSICGFRSKDQLRKECARRAGFALMVDPRLADQDREHHVGNAVHHAQQLAGMECTRLVVPQLSKTQKVCVVTGYVHVATNPRTEEEYRRLGSRLREAVGDKATFHQFECKVEDCWLWGPSQGARPAIATNPAKDTLEYHVVQHQKTLWLQQATELHPECNVFVWIDYGIFHQQGHSEEHVQAFLELAKQETGIAVPGCWDRNLDHDDEKVNWRFCGSVVVAHRSQVRALHQAVELIAKTRLLINKFVTWEVNDWARAEPMLPIRWYRAGHDQTMFTGYNPTELYESSTPSVAVVGGKLQCVVRAVNYDFDQDRIWFTPKDGTGIIRTRNFLCDLDGDSLEVTSSREIGDVTGDQRFDGKIKGVEDCRLFECDGKRWISGTVYDRNPTDHREYFLASLDESGDVDRMLVNRSIEPGLIQKNWMPVAGTRKFVYRCGPCIVLDWSGDQPQAISGSTQDNANLSLFRGSSQLVRWLDGWVAVVHEASRAGGLHYLHRFVRFGPELTVTGISDPFFFRQRGTEYCCGLARWRGKFLVSFSVKERESWIGSFDERKLPRFHVVRSKPRVLRTPKNFGYSQQQVSA